MLKRRLIPVLFLRNGFIVRSELFKSYKNIGNPILEAKRFNDWDVDELIYIDISDDEFHDSRRDDHKTKFRSNFLSVVEEVTKVCRMPLTFGGGIRTMTDIQERLFLGVDKVTLNRMAVSSPEFIVRAVQNFGSQCITASVDYKVKNQRAFVHSPCLYSTEIDLIEHCIHLQELGVGEIFLNCVDRDGTGQGYDLDTINLVSDAISVPLVVCGGAASEYDILELAVSTTVSGLAAGNMFHFTELSYPRTKKLLAKKNVNVRVR